MTLDVTFPEGEGGDAAREILPRTIQQIQDRLCTVGRTVTLGEPVAYVEGALSTPRSSPVEALRAGGVERRGDPGRA